MLFTKESTNKKERSLVTNGSSPALFESTNKKEQTLKLESSRDCYSFRSKCIFESNKRMKILPLAMGTCLHVKVVNYMKRNHKH
jgi:hypothetical protein